MPTAPSKIRSWLFDEAFPFWSTTGMDRNGPGFVEHLTIAGVPAEVDFKRVRVQARQVYCFSQAALLGWPGPALDCARKGLDLLTGRAWLGVDGGWASLLSRDGSVRDDTPDLYDIAFVLFALGWWMRASGDTSLVPLGRQTLDFLETRFRHPSGLGFLHRGNCPVQSVQNPHMHLTEAMIVLRDVTGDERFARMADKLVRLCLDRFIDEGTGALAEEFADDWSWPAARDGVSVEPGHHYEWVWLLKQYLNGPCRDPRRAEDAMRALFAFAVRHGQHEETDLVYDGVKLDGTPSKLDYRCWPQTERLKAWLAMHELDGRDPVPAVTKGVDQILAHYLDTQPRGTWIEYRDPQLRPKIDKIPTSMFYHIVLAGAEVLRAAPLFERSSPEMLRC